MGNETIRVPRHHYPYFTGFNDVQTSVQTGGRLPPEGILKLEKALLPASANAHSRPDARDPLIVFKHLGTQTLQGLMAPKG
jgi:hypothetical protein